MLTTIVFMTTLTATPVYIPGGPPIAMDYIAYDAKNKVVWVPAGNSAKVDVVDLTSGMVTPIKGFHTAPSTRPGRPALGPSSVTVAGNEVFVGNRADKTVCPLKAKDTEVDAKKCITLPSAPDGIAWVASKREVWATTPETSSVAVIEPSKTVKTIKLDGEPEGYAVDQERGFFYTNLEDKDQTLAIDVRSKKVVATYSPNCGKEGPRGLALDERHRLLFVACTNGAVALDLRHEGKEVGRIQTGGGVDNIDFAPQTRLLYIASGQDGTLTVARVAEDGKLESYATGKTSPGARVVIADGQGDAWVADSRNARLLHVEVPKPSK